MTDEQYRAKQELMMYKQAKRNIADLKEKIEIKESEVNAICKPLKDNISQRSASGNSAEQLIDALMDLRNEYYRQQVEAEKICYSLEQKIFSMGNCLYKRILRNYYLFGESLEKIAVQENYCYKQIKRSHLKALTEYYKLKYD